MATKASSANYYDRLMYLVSIGGSLFTLPQLLQVWVMGKTDGVSLVTWSAYTALAVLWLIYGVRHGQMPLILAQALIVIMDAGIVAGLLLR